MASVDRPAFFLAESASELADTLLARHGWSEELDEDERLAIYGLIREHLDRGYWTADFIILVLQRIAQRLNLPSTDEAPPGTFGKPPSQLPPAHAVTTASVRRLPAGLSQRYPSLTTPFHEWRDHAPAVPAGAGRSPRALRRRAQHFMEGLRSASKPYHDVAGFFAGRDVRSRAIEAVSGIDGHFPRLNWRLPNVDDFACGVLSQDGVLPASTVFDLNGNLAQVDILIQTTFPVGPGGGSLLEGEHSSDKGFRWSSTAWRLNSAQQTLTPTTVHRTGWTDSNSAPRPAGERTNSTDPPQRMANRLTEQMLDPLTIRVRLLAQQNNRLWFIDNMMPTHVSAAIPEVGAESFESPAEEWDRFWHWNTLDGSGAFRRIPHGYRAIHDVELALYCHLNVLEASAMVPFSPPSVFVRRFRGGADQLAYFTPHFCNLDPFAYSSLNFTVAANLIERAMRSYEALFSGVDCSFRSLSGPPTLSSVFGSFVHGQAWLHSASDDRSDRNGFLSQLYQLRRLELNSGRAFDGQLSPQLQRLAAERLLHSTDPRDLDSYKPEVGSTEPPSIICDLIRYYGTLRLPQLARREADAEAGTIGPGDFEFEVLEEIRKSTHWRAKLVSIGVEPIFLDGPQQFRRALTLMRRSPEYQDVQRKKSIANASEEAMLFISQHITGTDNLAALLRGSLSSSYNYRRGTVQFRQTTAREDLFLSMCHACEECATLGFAACAMPLEEAVESGILIDLTSHSAVLKSVDSWFKTIEYEEEKRGRLHLRLHDQLLQAAATLEYVAI